MKRGYIARKPRKRRVKAVGKRLGRSMVSKGPARDPGHLARVRQESCIACRAASARTEAHHVRCIGARTLGKRVSDYLTVPLCQFCHRDAHSINEAQWWKRQGINMTKLDPAQWIAQFSAEGAAEIARLNGARAKPSTVNEDHHA